jgi:aminopeptidase N
MRTILLLAILLVSALHVCAQPGSIDAKHYRFEIHLTDSSDMITGTATIRFRQLRQADSLLFDLVSADTSRKGMQVSSVSVNGDAAKFIQSRNKLRVLLPPASISDKEIKINYRGIPKDGLIISTNKFGDRTFFADNWPDRAKNWLPCVDDPADKASVEFIVTAPLQYQVVSNGVQVEETVLNDRQKLTHWKEDALLPTKIMVIGVAKFAVQYVGDTLGVPVYSWVYPQEKANAFYDYAQAKDVLPFFIKNIAPFPYPKLANVQSKTIFGGMENAGCIFYNENVISGERKAEDLLAHEIAHQWFGDMATETSFAHLWLSEGFATYMTDLYIGQKYGTDSMNKRLREEREEVIRFNRRTPKAVVDSLTTNFMQLLNANSYQKGAWVLHMLRGQVGADVFWKGIQAYYKRHAGSNASTDDFRKVMEEVSGKDLKAFFKQWLYTAGHPLLKVRHDYDVKKKTLTIHITQQQAMPFSFPLEVQLKMGSTSMKRVFQVNKKEERFSISNIVAVNEVVIDPSTMLLFEQQL